MVNSVINPPMANFSVIKRLMMATMSELCTHCFYFFNFLTVKRGAWLFCLSALSAAAPLSAQNWPTFGGGNDRSGRTKIGGPESVATPKWTVTNSASTSLGNAVYAFGNRFVTSRVTFSPYKGNIECRDLQTGALLWTSPFISNTSILYAAGFTPDAVYAHDYATDTIFALRPDNGQIKWRSSIRSHTFGAYPGFVFACNGDPIVNGPASQGHTVP